MAQGSRGRWVRVAAAGLGVFLCTGLVGCMNGDKLKDKLGKQPTQGLPGTPKLDTAGNPVGAKAGQPGGTSGMGSTFGSSGVNVQPTGGFPPATGATPSRVGTTGMNTNTSGSMPHVNYQPGVGGGIGAPAQTGIQPTGGSTSGLPQPDWSSKGGATSGAAPVSPPAPTLDNVVLPPPPPIYGSGSGEFGAGGPVQPPVAPIAPGPIPPTNFGK